MLSGLVLVLIAVFSFLLLLSFLVFFHELGHYSVARMFGIAVDRFSIGFGKPIWRRTSKAGVEWVISRIPLGGYVKFAGDAGAASNPDVEKLEEIRTAYESDPNLPDIENVFHFRPVWQRALVVVAGPVANFILAILLFASAGLAVKAQYVSPVVTSVIAETPAEAAGFQEGDIILKLDGKEVQDIDYAIQYIRLRSGTDIEATIERGGQPLMLVVKPDRMEIRDAVGGKSKVGQVGLQLQPGTNVTQRIDDPISALGYGVDQTGNVFGATMTYLGRLVSLKEDGKQLGSVGKIATVTSVVSVNIAKADASFMQRLRAWAYFMVMFSASISIALGVANLMPLPVLDGGHLMYYGYEAIAGQPLSQQKQEFGFKIGFAILITLFVVLTLNDIGYVGSIIS